MIYLDANVAIRLIEGDAATRAPLESRLTGCRGVPHSVVTSRLTRLECRVKPLRAANATLLAEYDAFLTSIEMVLYELTPAVVEQATDIRAVFRFKTPDALHLATAVVAGASVFLTGDRDLARCTLLPVEVL